MRGRQPKDPASPCVHDQAPACIVHGGMHSHAGGHAYILQLYFEYVYVIYVRIRSSYKLQTCHILCLRPRSSPYHPHVPHLPDVSFVCHPTCRANVFPTAHLIIPILMPPMYPSCCPHSCGCSFDGFAGPLCEEHTEMMCVNQCSGHGECIIGFCK